MKDVLLVTAADENYADLLRGLISSIIERTSIKDIAVLDVGLGSGTKLWLTERSVTVIEARWMFSFEGQEAAPRHLMSMTSRPFLPQLFPAYSTILWMDADTWIQDESAVRLFLKGAELSDIAVVPELDRSYKTNVDGGRHRQYIYGFYALAYGEGFIPPGADPPQLLNSGVFAMRRESPVWKLWAEEIIGLGPRIVHFTAEQMALNVVLYSKPVTKMLLPSTCNWLVLHAVPALDGDILVEPNLPFAKIGVIHLAGGHDKRGEFSLGTLDGKLVRRRLLYS